MKDELQLKLPVLSRKTYSIYYVLHQFSCCQSALVLKIAALLGLRGFYICLIQRETNTIQAKIQIFPSGPSCQV